MNVQAQREVGNGKPSLEIRLTGHDIDLMDAGFRYAYSLTHHQQDAEDLVQQACLRVFRRKGRLKEKGYLFVTMRNIFLDGCRRNSLLTFEGLSKDTIISNGSAGVQNTQDKLDLETILGTLQSEEREILYLNCMEGFTAREVSEITKQPRGTILSQLARIKKKLAARFNSDVTQDNYSRDS